MAVAPSTASAELSVAWKVCPCVAVSESTGSTSLTAKVVPEGMVTFCGGGGGGGGGGGAGATGAGAGAGVGGGAACATTGGASLCSFSLRRCFTTGAGFGGSGGGA